MSDDQARPEFTAELLRELRAQAIQFSDDLAGMSLRLAVAERVCLMFGWMVVTQDGERAKAAYMLWREWADLVGDDFTSPDAHPEMTDEWIASLAGERDAELRARTLERMGQDR